MTASGHMIYRGLFVLIAALLSFLAILPVDLWPARVPGPDLLVCTAFAWVFRRPDFVPVLLVAFIMLITDILFLRPPGLWSALTILGLEFLRRREHMARDLPFLFEWMTVSMVMAAMTLGYWLALTVTFAPHPGAALLAAQLVVTVASYPIVVFVSRHVFGVRRLTAAEADAIRRQRA